MTSPTFTILTILATLAMAHAEPIILSDHDVVIAPHTQKRLDFALPSGANTDLRLLIEARLEADSHFGTSRLMKLSLNGTPLAGAKDRTTRRIVNKAPTFKWENGNEYMWTRGEGLWDVVASPDFESAQALPWFGGEAAHWYVFVVDDLVVDGENALVIHNNSGKHHLVVRNVRVETHTAVTESVRSGPAGSQGGTTVAAVSLTGGAPLISLGTETLPIGSLFSYPQPDGWNQLGAAGTAGEPGWSPVTERVNDREWTCTATGEQYALKRSIRFHLARIDISDTFTNRSATEPVGIIIDNFIDLRRTPLADAYLGGREDPSLNEVYAPSNPTLFLPVSGQNGLGLVAEDDVYRNQAAIYFDAKTLRCGLRTANFYLAPGSTTTLRWSIYLVDSGDYYDFINRVRRDWDIHTQIDGSYVFMPGDRLLAAGDKSISALAGTGTHVVMTSSWKDPKTGEYHSYFSFKPVGVLDDTEESAYLRDVLKRAAARIHKLAPGVPVLAKIHCYHNIVRRQNELEEFKDSAVYDATGVHIKDSNYGYCYYPSLDNSYGKAFIELVEWFIEEVGVDGFYWDELSGAGVTSGSRPTQMVFGPFDGHTATISPETHRIERKAAIYALLCDRFKKQVIDSMLARNLLVLANSQPCTAAMQRYRFPRMVESHVQASDSVLAHMHAPLAYTRASTSVADFRYRLSFGAIPLRRPLGEGQAPIDLSFPITVQRLAKGTIVGERKVITSVDHTLEGWVPGTNVRRYDIDADGKVAHSTLQLNAAPFRVVVPPDGLVVLEQVP